MGQNIATPKDTRVRRQRERDRLSTAIGQTPYYVRICRNWTKKIGRMPALIDFWITNSPESKARENNGPNFRKNLRKIAETKTAPTGKYKLEKEVQK